MAKTLYEKLSEDHVVHQEASGKMVAVRWWLIAQAAVVFAGCNTAEGGISYIFPLTAFIPIARGIFMKGIGLPFLMDQILFLIVYDVVILIIAARLFRQTLD